MKITITAIILGLLLAAPAHAQTSEQVDACASFGELAEQAVSARYSGVSLTQALSVISDDEPIREIAVAIIRDAYRLHRMRAEANQIEQAAEFRSEVEIVCLDEITR